MSLKNGDIIEHVDDCSAPKEMAGKKGQRKTVGKDIDLYYAKRLIKGNRAKVVTENQTVKTKGAVNAVGKGDQAGSTKNTGPEKP
jgi:hypothetical protein